jgi:hypothetical protein
VLCPLPAGAARRVWDARSAPQRLLTSKLEPPPREGHGEGERGTAAGDDGGSDGPTDCEGLLFVDPILATN